MSSVTGTAIMGYGMESSKYEGIDELKGRRWDTLSTIFCKTLSAHFWLGLYLRTSTDSIVPTQSYRIANSMVLASIDIEVRHDHA